MRKQPTRVITGAARKYIIISAFVLLAGISAVSVIFAALYEPPYIAPPFEPAAVRGVPNPPDNMRYSDINAAGRFTFWLAGTAYQQADGSLYLYLTNPEENEVYLMCRVTDKNGAELYRSGLLRPGEYVERLELLKKLENEALDIKIYIYALDPDNFYSVGTVTLDNILQPN